MTMIIDKFAMPTEADRRRKLTDQDREDIKSKFKEFNPGIRALAREYGVDKRLINFILFPERLAHHKALSKQRRLDGRYKETTEQRTIIMREYRAHKKQSLIDAEILTKNGKVAVKDNGSQLFK